MKRKRNKNILDFERPLFNLLEQISALESPADPKEVNHSYLDLIKSLKLQFEELKTKLYANLQPDQVLQIARHPARPYVLDYIKQITENNWYELHGDRAGHDDSSIVGGITKIEEHNVMIVGMEKGKDIKEKQKRNFGMPQPWGYKKALRLFKHADKFNFPIITLVDTPGAYPGLEAESCGQSIAIAENIKEMFTLSVPVITVIIGEGGSGGALALSVANRIFMLEYSVYSVISPEGCAAILWRTREKFAKAAKALKITAKELLELGLIDGIIKESLGGSHNDYSQTAQNLKTLLLEEIRTLKSFSSQELKTHRAKKFRAFGAFKEMI